MANDRLSQLPVEGVVLPTDATARLSQEPTEAVVLPTDAKARASSESVEAVVSPTDAKARASSLVIETVVSGLQPLTTILIDQTAVAFAPTVVAAPPGITVGLITQTAVAYAPTVTNPDLSVYLPYIDQRTIAFAPEIILQNRQILLGLINQRARPFYPIVDTAPLAYVELLADGIDIWPDVYIESARFTSIANGIPGSCFMRVKDINNDKSFTIGARFKLRIAGRYFWSGFITKQKYVYPFDAEDRTTLKPRLIELEGVDLNILFTKRYTFDQTTPTHVEGPTYPAYTADTTAVADLVTDWLDLTGDAIDTDTLVENVGYINQDQLANAWSGGWQWGQAMQAIARLPAGLFYINPDSQLVLTDVDTPSVPWVLSDQPEAVASGVGYREMTIINDGGMLANDVLIWGAGMGSDTPVFRRVQDATSIAAHGRWQYAEIKGDIYKQTSIDRVANSIVYGSPQSKRGRKDDRRRITLTTFDPYFRVSDKTRFISAVYDFDEVFPVRQETISFDGPDEPRFALTLSHETDLELGLFDNFKYKPFHAGGFDPVVPITRVRGGDTCCGGNLVLGINTVDTGGGGLITPTVQADNQPQTSLPGYVELYENCTYKARWGCLHSSSAGVDSDKAVILYRTDSGNKVAEFAGDGNGVTAGSVWSGTASYNGYSTFSWTLGGPDPFHAYLKILESGAGRGDMIGSQGYVSIWYVSGPDPRFPDNPSCDPEACSSIGGDVVLDGASDVVDGDGLSTVYTLSQPYLAGTTYVSKNGLYQRPGIDYFETDPLAGIITFVVAPLSTDLIRVLYTPTTATGGINGGGGNEYLR